MGFSAERDRFVVYPSSVVDLNFEKQADEWYVVGDYFGPSLTICGERSGRGGDYICYLYEVGNRSAVGGVESELDFNGHLEFSESGEYLIADVAKDSSSPGIRIARTRGVSYGTFLPGWRLGVKDGWRIARNRSLVWNTSRTSIAEVDLETQEFLREYTFPGLGIRQAAFESVSRQIVVALTDGTTRWIDYVSGIETWRVNYTGAIQSLVPTIDGSLVAYIKGSQTTAIYRLQIHQQPLLLSETYPTARIIGYGETSSRRVRTVSQFTLLEDRETARTIWVRPGTLGTSAVFREGLGLVVATQNGVVLLNEKTGDLVRQRSARITAPIELSPSGLLAAVPTSNGIVIVRTSSMRPSAVITPLVSGAKDFKFSADNRALLYTDSTSTFLYAVDLKSEQTVSLKFPLGLAAKTLIDPSRNTLLCWPLGGSTLFELTLPQLEYVRSKDLAEPTSLLVKGPQGSVIMGQANSAIYLDSSTWLQRGNAFSYKVGSVYFTSPEGRFLTSRNALEEITYDLDHESQP